MYGASDRRSVSAGHFRSNDLLEARESARTGNELFEFTQFGRCRRAQRAWNIIYYLHYAFLLIFVKIYHYFALSPNKYLDLLARVACLCGIRISILNCSSHGFSRLSPEETAYPGEERAVLSSMGSAVTKILQTTPESGDSS
ncbi:hypothetical protein [Prosthecochloris aestuarii]|uniref:hypothetical protein n=1 Tax=Prosthecochloris aestuarii TaxID=1102 RepID=UPI001231CE8E|nr:hypothetical protein [Prosthecochloris aestuarii]